MGFLVETFEVVSDPWIFGVFLPLLIGHFYRRGLKVVLRNCKNVKILQVASPYFLPQNLLKNLP
jgi:hypothetical protein